MEDEPIHVTEEVQNGLLNTAFVLSMELYERAQKEPLNNAFYQSVDLGVLLFVGYIEKYSQMHGELDLKQWQLYDLAKVGQEAMKINHDRIKKILEEES